MRRALAPLYNPNERLPPLLIKRRSGENLTKLSSKNVNPMEWAKPGLRYNGSTKETHEIEFKREYRILIRPTSIKRRKDKFVLDFAIFVVSRLNHV